VDVRPRRGLEELARCGQARDRTEIPGISSTTGGRSAISGMVQGVEMGYGLENTITAAIQKLIEGGQGNTVNTQYGATLPTPGDSGSIAGRLIHPSVGVLEGV